MDEPTETPKLRRAWLAGYRVTDVEVLLAELRFKVSHLRDETQRLASRLSDVEHHRSEHEPRVGSELPRALEAATETSTPTSDGLENAHAEAEAIIASARSEAERIRIRAEVATTDGARPPASPPETMLARQFGPALRQDPGLRRARFRGYRRGDVEAAFAHEQLLRARLELDLDAALNRTIALQAEIDDLNDRIVAGRAREASLAEALDEVRQRRELAEREAQHRADQLLRDAEERVASLKTEGLRQVGALQGQVESLLDIRATMTETMQRLSQDLAATMARLAAGPATAIDRKPEDQLSRWASPDD